MSVALYCRVSTEEQAANGFSIDNQISRLRAYCESQGWSDLVFYVDDGCTGTNLDRPQMQALMEDIMGQRINAVVVYKLDRLSRCQKDVLYLLEDLFEKHHVVFKSVTEPFDTSTPLGRAMVGILAVFGQLERDTIVERTKSGKSERTRQGLWYGGPVPFGYEWSAQAQQLHILPEQATLVQSAFQQFLEGHSYRSIGKWLSLQTKERQFENHKTVSYMLSNPIYSGKLNFQGECILGAHEAIVGQDTYDDVQLEKRKRKHGQKEIGKYLLSHILTCGQCNAPMIHVRTIDKRHQKAKYRGYYVCSAKRQRTSPCTNKWYSDIDLEAKILQHIGNILIDVPVRSTEEDLNKRARNDATELKKRLTTINKKLHKWYRAFEEEIDDDEEKHMMARMQELRQTKEHLMKQMTETSCINDDTPPNILDKETALESYLPYLTNEELRSVLRAAIRNITIHLHDSILISWNL